LSATFDDRNIYGKRFSRSNNQYFIDFNIEDITEILIEVEEK